MTDLTEQYDRYYFYYDDNGNLTCQLSNAKMSECVTTTTRTIHEHARLTKIAQLRLLLTYAYQQHEEGGLKKLERRMESRLNDLLAKQENNDGLQS